MKVDMSRYTKQHTLEACCAIIHIRKTERKYIVIGLYRPPQIDDVNEFFHLLTELLLDLYDPRYSFMVTGDFNIDRLCNNKHNIELENVLACYNINLTLNEPTRVT